MLLNLLFVFLGGGMGSVCRYSISLLIPSAWQAYPWATLAVNVLGSFLIGLFLWWGAEKNISSVVRPLFVIGFCGGFTTFSSFSVEVISMMREGRWGAGLAYVSLSLFLSLLAFWSSSVMIKSSN